MQEGRAPSGRLHVKNGRLAIRELPPDLRPRERLISFGAGSLSSSELVAVIMGTGTRNETVVGLGERILAHFGSVGLLSASTLEELVGIGGVGEVKATKLLAALELGRRLNREGPAERAVISGPRDVVDLLMPAMRHLDREHFKALILNTKNRVLRTIDVSIGSLNSSVVHPRELYKMVIRHNGAAVIVAHNHPSGDPTPSPEDVVLTRRLLKAGAILGIELLDHIVLGDGSFASMKERELM